MSRGSYHADLVVGTRAFPWRVCIKRQTLRISCLFKCQIRPSSLIHLHTWSARALFLRLIELLSQRSVHSIKLVSWRSVCLYVLTRKKTCFRPVAADWKTSRYSTLTGDDASCTSRTRESMLSISWWSSALTFPNSSLRVLLVALSAERVREECDPSQTLTSTSALRIQERLDVDGENPIGLVASVGSACSVGVQRWTLMRVDGAVVVFLTHFSDRISRII